MIYEQLKEEELSTRKVIIEVKEKSSKQLEEHAFIIEKIDSKVKDDVLFINSAIPILQKFIEKIKSKDLISQDLIKKVISCITDLIFFCTESDSEDPLEAEGISIQYRQRMMKDFKIIERCMDILYYPFRLGLYDIKNLDKVDSDIIKIFKLDYQLIKHIIKEYRPNELYASQWLELLIN